jgi:hypothetical protein
MPNTKYLKAKNGIEILHEDGVTQILSGNGDPSVIGVEAGIGSIFLRSDSEGKTYNKTGTSSTSWELISQESDTNLDGGSAASVYGGTESIDGGSASTTY